MIASLTGAVQSTTGSQIVLNVSGVGYLVHVTPALALSMTIGDLVSVHTTLVVREDSMTIFGFSDADELELFDLLRSVTGVGPKSALGILSTLGADAVRNAVATENDAAFKSVSGIGPKTAKVIAATLAGKVHPTASAAPPASNAGDAELVAALVGLGWSDRAAATAIQEAVAELDIGAARQEVLRAALNRLAAGKSIVGGE